MTLQEWAPITFSMAFFEAPLDRVSEALIAWVRGQEDGQELRVSQLREPFPDVLLRLEPLTMVSRQRELAIATTGAWTAYFDNIARGTEAASAGRHLTQVLGCRGLAITNQPHTIGTPGIKRGLAGATMFELFGPTRGEFLNYVRTVAAAWDGDRWVFQLTGTPQAFEDQTRYKARLVRDRFTPQMLVEYCQALGVDPYNPGFYRSEAVRVERTGPLPPTDQELSLQQARQWMELI